MGRAGISSSEVGSLAEVNDKDDMQNRRYMIDEAME